MRAGQLAALAIGFTFWPPRDLPALQLTETHTPDPVVIGSTLTFTFTLYNDGGTPASGTLFTNAIPPSTVFVSATVSSNLFTLVSNVFTYTPNAIQPGAKPRFSLVLLPVTTQPITNIAGWVGTNGEVSEAWSQVTVSSTAPGPKMQHGRIAHAGTRLMDGRVLVTGGRSFGSSSLFTLSNAEIFRTNQNSFAPGRFGNLRYAATD